MCVRARARVVCVCVCVCETEREIVFSSAFLHRKSVDRYGLAIFISNYVVPSAYLYNLLIPYLQSSTAMFAVLSVREASTWAWARNG